MARFRVCVFVNFLLGVVLASSASDFMTGHTIVVDGGDVMR